MFEWPIIRGFNNVPKHNNLDHGYQDDTPKGAARILNSLQVRQAYQAKKKSGEDTGPANGKGKGGGVNAQQKRAGKDTSMPKILPGETLGEFNRRLEDHLRPEVSGAIKAAAAKKAADEKEIWMQKKARREEAKEARRRKERGEKAPTKDAVETGTMGMDNKGKRKASTLLDESDGSDSDERCGTGIDTTNRVKNKKPARKTEFETLSQRRSVNDVVQAPPRLPMLKKSGAKKPPPSAFSATGRVPLNAGQQRLMEEERTRVIQRYRELKENKLREKEANQA